ncbi:hypothetical protein [Vibrio diazotrophicus]|uniref:hypothetical protein n=1 Tax=Vibrio diazotrophicus TaxID=685 RepID=UPI0015E0B866|nr:hypothetical protein [Vibrio diazotrophicus]
MDVLNKQDLLIQREAAILKPLSTIHSDNVGNLIRVYTEAYKQASQRLQEVSERILQQQLLTDSKLKSIVYQRFNDRISSYIDYLVLNKDDLNNVEEIASLLVEFPQLQPLFEEE